MNLFRGEAKRLSRKSLRSIAEVWQSHHVEETIVFQNLPEGMAQENTWSNGRLEKTRDGWVLIESDSVLTHSIP